jgi:hypothetical protein
VQPIVQGTIVPNKRIDEIIGFIKDHHKPLPQIKRSGSCPSKTHIGVVSPWAGRKQGAS